MSGKASPADIPVNVIKKSTGLDTRHRSANTALAVHEQQTEAVSVMAKTLEVDLKLCLLNAPQHSECQMYIEHGADL